MNKIPMGGELTLVLDKKRTSSCVLRVVNGYHGSHDPYAPATIAAIKAYREVMGCSLLDAKLRVERIKPVERPGLGPWGRPAWDYALSAEEAQWLSQPHLPTRSSVVVEDSTSSSTYTWELIFS